jgi:ABC-type multidrug transport system fused ATPase/permease subunit
VAGVVGMVVVMEAKTIGSTAAGIVLIYSLSFQENLTFLTRMHAECQMAMNSVERVREYSELEPERYGQDITTKASTESPHIHTSACNTCINGVTRVICCMDQRAQTFNRVSTDVLTLDAMESSSMHNSLVCSKMYVPHNWPTAGHIEFKGISLKYRSSSQPVLHKVSFKIPSRKKIGTYCTMCLHMLYNHYIHTYKLHLKILINCCIHKCVHHIPSFMHAYIHICTYSLHRIL